MGHLKSVARYEKIWLVSNYNRNFYFENSYLGYEGKLTFRRSFKNLDQIKKVIISNVIGQYSISNGSIWCVKEVNTICGCIQ